MSQAVLGFVNKLFSSESKWAYVQRSESILKKQNPNRNIFKKLCHNALTVYCVAAHVRFATCIKELKI